MEAGQITDLARDVESSDLAAPFIEKIRGEPRMGEIVELGFGTQPFPRTGVETQDEKVLGTFHIALGRNDFLGGKNGPEEFLKRENALHKDILYHPYLQPEISDVVVQIVRSDGREMTIIEDFKPTKALEEAIRLSDVGSLLPSY